jgi:cytochrome c-type biogenesis protein CcmH/NrfF
MQFNPTSSNRLASALGLDILSGVKHLSAKACGFFGVALLAVTSPLGCGGCAHPAAHAQQAAPATAVSSVSAERPSLDEVAGELICDNPHCSKESLRECTSCENAVRHRDEIARQLEAGKSKVQIVNWFGDTYGEHLLGNPRSQWAAAVPLGAVALGLLPLALILRSRRPRTPASTSRARKAPVQDAEDPRVAAALRDFDY